MAKQAPKFDDVKATDERTGCDRPGCTTPIAVGDDVRTLNGKTYCQTAACTGLFQTEAAKLGVAYVEAVTSGSDLPNVSDYLNRPEQRAAKVTAAKVEKAVEDKLAAMSDDDIVALVTKLRAGNGKTADLAGTAKATSRSKRS